MSMFNNKHFVISRFDNLSKHKLCIHVKNRDILRVFSQLSADNFVILD